MSVMVTGPVTLEDMDVIIEALHSQVEHLSGTDAAALLTQVSCSAAKLSAYRVSLVSKVQSSQVWRDEDPNATAASFLREELVLDHREAKADLRAAESFGRFPELEKACRDGRLSRDKMDLILSFGLRNPQREAALPEFLTLFIEAAAHATCSELRQVLQRWADQIDPVTVTGDDHDAHQRRELHVHQLGDGVKVDGFFGMEQGMRLITALNGVLDKQWRKANDPTNTGHATTTADKVVSSTAASRADAFIEGIISPVLEAGLVPTAGGVPATVCVTVPLERLEHPNQPANLDEVKTRIADGTLRHHSPSIRATNGPGESLISIGTALKMSCDASIQRVVLDPVGKPLDIGRRTRVIPEQIRTALVIRDGGCVFPYCDKPAGWAEGHHIQHWSHGGDTSLNNLVLLCSRHHHQIHADHIPITFDSDGKPRVRLEHRYKDRL